MPCFQKACSSKNRINKASDYHGFFEGGVNYLGPVDASKASIPETCVSITKSPPLLVFAEVEGGDTNMLFVVN
jgi:hypothetical protein